MPAVSGENPLAQGALLTLMAVAFAAILLARLTAGPGDDSDRSAPGGAGGAIQTARATNSQPASSDGATPVPSVGPSDAAPSVDPGPSGTVPPTASGTVSTTPAPTARPRTYTVQRGDTLSGIAGRFGTTVAVLQDLNDIDDPARLRIGQELDLP
jgi:LysM repeat protein